MHKLIILIAALAFIVSCEKPQKPSVQCTIASIGVPVVSNMIVAKIKTCNATKLSDKILQITNCKQAKVFNGLNIDKSAANIACPIVISILSDLAAQGTALLDVGCDPAIIKTLLNQPNVCQILFK